MNNINIIDIEASGLHFDSYPIEVAVMCGGKIKSWLIKPEPNWNYWCDIAESIHGISRQQLLEQGQSASQVADELETFLKNSNGILYSDAAEWDTDWIDTLFIAKGFPKAFHIDSIFNLLEGNQKACFIDEKARLVESGKYRQHRAEEDVRLINQSFNEVIRT